jgi:hypothetical protein
MLINTSATAAYQICLLADESCSSSDHIDIIIIAQVYTIYITIIHMRILFITLRISIPRILIFDTLLPHHATSRETFSIASPQGITIAASTPDI